jgi:hypothetical protein
MQYHIIARVGALVALFVTTANWIACGGSSTPTATPTRNLLTVAVQPQKGTAVFPNGTLPFTATGTFDQAPITEDSMTVQWSSSDTSVATVDSASGMATCIKAGGPVTVTASKDGKNGTADFECADSTAISSGFCVYQCGSTRCGALTGYCSVMSGGACRQISAIGACPVGRAAGATATDSCGVGIDTTRPCGP